MTKGEKPVPDIPSVSVIMAFHKPSLVLAGKQIDSLLAQTGVKLSLVAVIDGAETARDSALMAQLRAAGAAIIINDVGLGARRSFAEGLRRAIARSAGNARYFAYCDQDDVWHPQKLSRSIAVLRAEGAALVHCDARVLDENGSVIAPSLYRFESRQESGDLLGVLLLNSVTGMTAVFPARTARATLPVLDRYHGALLHDHVTAAVAASIGKIAFMDEALVDYVQHGGNQIGARRPRPVLRRPALGIAHYNAYRATSAEIFESRRDIASVLAQEDLLPGDLNAMFLVGHRPSAAAFVRAYMRETRKLTLAGQFRRAIIAARMMDAGLRALRRR